MFELVDLNVEVLQRLAADDVAGASELLSLDVPLEVIVDGAPWAEFARRRAQPGSQGWTSHLFVEDGMVVGHGGFHEPPNDEGLVEIGYTIAAHARGKKRAQRAVRILLERARESGRVRTVRGCTAPDNVASRAVLSRCGFILVGEIEDDEDGLELVHEVRLS